MSPGLPITLPKGLTLFYSYFDIFSAGAIFFNISSGSHFWHFGLFYPSWLHHTCAEVRKVGTFTSTPEKEYHKITQGVIVSTKCRNGVRLVSVTGKLSFPLSRYLNVRLCLIFSIYFHIFLADWWPPYLAVRFWGESKFTCKSSVKKCNRVLLTLTYSTMLRVHSSVRIQVNWASICPRFTSSRLLTVFVSNPQKYILFKCCGAIWITELGKLNHCGTYI